MRFLVPIVALLCLAPACPPDPQPPTPPAPLPDASPPVQDAGWVDSGPADDCTGACATARVLGCPEASDMLRCIDACRAAHGVIADFAPRCVAACTDVACVRRCSSSWRCAGK